jgi:hypothetical protein
MCVDIVHKTDNYIPVKSLMIRVENEESHEIQIQGISPSVFLKPGESYEFSVKADRDANGEGAYICAFNTAVRVKIDISGGYLGDATIRIRGLAGDGP